MVQVEWHLRKKLGETVVPKGVKYEGVYYGQLKKNSTKGASLMVDAGIPRKLDAGELKVLLRLSGFEKNFQVLVMKKNGSSFYDLEHEMPHASNVLVIRAKSDSHHRDAVEHMAAHERKPLVRLKHWFGRL